jgi:phage tail-like protein
VSSALSNFQPGDRHPASGRSPDPAPVLRFLVKVGTEPIGRFQECTGIQVEYETLEWPEGGENRFVHKLRGRAKYPNLVLKRGITHEKNLVQWFRDCADRTKRFAITVELLAGDLKPIRRFSFDMAYPVKWSGPNLNAGQNNAAVESLEIVHQGFAEL